LSDTKFEPFAEVATTEARAFPKQEAAGLLGATQTENNLDPLLQIFKPCLST
jgi:hypothetical protein